MPGGLEDLKRIVGSNHVVTDPDVLAGRSVDHTGRYRGRASALVRPGSAEQVAEVLRVCRDAGAHVTVQGGRTSLVAGTVPEHDDVLLSTERLRALDESTPSSAASGSAPVPRWRRCNAPRAPRAWCSAWTWPPATPRPSGGWRRRTPAACARSGTATWASKSSAWRWRCPTGRCCAGTAGCAGTTPATTCRRCSSAPRAPSVSSPRWICGCTPPRRSG